MPDNDYKFKQDGYVAFDAISLKDLIIEKMNDQKVFTDQNYEGSNLSAIIDIVAYSYHVLIYYLNKNSSESNFSQAELYENINQIVKSIDYNPTGPQTANINFEAVANANLSINSYTIPRFSYFTFSGTSYSFVQDVTFQKTLNGVEALIDLQNNNLLYNGQFVEFPIFSAIGEENEVAFLAATDTTDNFYIDNNNIYVYVLPGGVLNPKWEQWSRSSSLYLETGSAKKYSVRFNENEQYEIKFGNNINGKKLNEGDLVAIYYLKSDGQNGQISKNQIDNQQLYFYNTTQFNAILNDTTSSGANIITSAEAANVSFTNANASTLFKTKESVEEIKVNAPNLFNSQYRLVTTDDYRNYILKNFGNWVKSASVVNNFDYTAIYQKYFFDIGLDRPNDDSRVLFNQVNFSDACDFNNVYIFAVPNKILETSLDIRTNFLSIAQKNAINILLNDVKSATTELVVSDPVYMELNFGASNGSDYDFIDAAGDESYLYVEVDRNSRRDLSSVQKEIASIFLDYFNNNNLDLGQLISLKDLSQLILDVDGVVEFSTRRNYKGSTIINNQLQLALYNPVYLTSDYMTTDQDIRLQYFQFPYFKNLSLVSERIEVIRQG